MSVVSSCSYPRCDDGQGNPTLTTLGMCTRCRRLYWKQLEWLVLDYVTIKTSMPAPVTTERGHRGRASRTFGHPAQWASDLAKDIAIMLNWLEDDLRELAGDTPPINLAISPEPRLVEHAWAYLNNHFEQLVQHPAARDLAADVLTLHSKIRGAMGFRRHFRTLQAPCPACDLIGFLTIGDGEGTDRITCEHCGEFIREEMFDFFVKTLAETALDSLIDAYDTQEAAVFRAAVGG